jgi:hypothetical protein
LALKRIASLLIFDWSNLISTRQARHWPMVQLQQSAECQRPLALLMDVLIAPHKKRGRAPVHGEDPSLRFSHPSRDDFCRAVPEGVSKAFRNTSLQRKSSQVSTGANALRPFNC